MPKLCWASLDFLQNDPTRICCLYVRLYVCILSYHLRIQKFMQQVARTAVPGSGDTTGSEQTLETWIQDHFGYLAAISWLKRLPKKSLRLDKAYPTRKNTCFASNIIWLPLPEQPPEEAMINWISNCGTGMKHYCARRAPETPVASTFTFAWHNWFLWTLFADSSICLLCVCWSIFTIFLFVSHPFLYVFFYYPSLWLPSLPVSDL